MLRDEVLRVLTDHRRDFLRFRVRSMSIFGSVARDQARPESDLDVLVEFEQPPSFDQFIGLKLYLEDLLGVPVDLVTRQGLRARIRSAVEQEAIRVA